MHRWGEKEIADREIGDEGMGERRGGGSGEDVKNNGWWGI